MTAEGKLDLVGGDAVAIIGDYQTLDATALDLDADMTRTGVKRIFYELLHHGRRPLDDFTSGDLRRQVRVEHADRARWCSQHQPLVRCLNACSSSSAAARRVTRSGTPARRATCTPYDRSAPPSTTVCRKTTSSPRSSTSTRYVRSRTRESLSPVS